MKSEWISPAEALKGHYLRQARRPAFGYLRLAGSTFEKFQTMNWAEVWHRVQRYRRHLNNQGLKAGDRIALQGMNSVEWVILDWASLISGIVSVPLFKGSARDEVDFILKESESKILFCDEVNPSISIKQISFTDLELDSSKLNSDDYPEPELDPDSLATIIYTSGTQGEPKGVMHSLRNLSAAIFTCNQIARLTDRDRLFSYLPLSHVAERVLVDLGSLYSGASVYFLDRVERLIQYLPEARPTIFLAVPRVWDTIRFRLEKELSHSRLRRWKKILGFAIRRKLGLDRARYCVSGAAKLSPETNQALSDYGIEVMEAYGLTETLGVSTLSRPGEKTMGSCGKLYPGIEAKIANDGEILLKAPFHFKGYYKQPELSAEVLKSDWFATGDIGHFDSDGNLFITDRKKNLFKTSSGKYVAPLVAETFLKNHPAVREALVAGENRAHCVALVSVDLTLVTSGEMERHLEMVNRKLPSHEHIKTLWITGDSWTSTSGELTPSMKLKRRVVMNKYASTIENIYESRARIIFEQEEGQLKRAHSSI